MPPLETIAIVGPTASGKTAWGLRMAHELNGEIISADSRQVYRFLSVGTAKPDGHWQSAEGITLYHVNGIPYHLVDFLEPDKKFTAADFVEHAARLINEIRGRGRTPLLVGGTGFYLSALEKGLAPLPPADASVRAELRAIAEEKGRAILHAELTRIDPEAAQKIPANNIHRVSRAIEVFRLTGIPLSQWHRRHQTENRDQHVPLRYLGIDVEPSILEDRIRERCHAMVEGGMIEETENLLKAGCRADAPALTGLGYPQVIRFLNGEINRSSLIEQLFQDTRRYAKRQRTWFRHQAAVEWKK